jgi:hypothetical protein
MQQKNRSVNNRSNSNHSTKKEQPAHRFVGALKSQAMPFNSRVEQVVTAFLAGFQYLPEVSVTGGNPPSVYMHLSEDPTSEVNHGIYVPVGISNEAFGTVTTKGAVTSACAALGVSSRSILETLGAVRLELDDTPALTGIPWSEGEIGEALLVAPLDAVYFAVRSVLAQNRE